MWHKKYSLSVCISFRTGPIWALSQTVRVLPHPHCSLKKNCFSISEHFFPMCPLIFFQHTSFSIWYSRPVRKADFSIHAIFFLFEKGETQGYNQSDGVSESTNTRQMRFKWSFSIGAVPCRHTLGSWLWRAVHAGVGGRHAPRRRDTQLIVDRGLLNWTEH